MEPTTDVEDQEMLDIIWDSRINICPGSTPTLAFSEHSARTVHEEITEKEKYQPEIKDSASKHAHLINWGADSSCTDVIIPGVEATADGEAKELGTTWESKINICPGSTPTLAFSSESVYYDEITQEKEGRPHVKDTSSKQCGPVIDWGSDSPWPDLIIPGTWGIQALEEHPWEDKKKPYTTFRKYLDLELDEVESEGVLTDRIIAACSSYLDRSPETEKYVLCKVYLANKHLTDISIIAYHHYLQYVDLSKNELTTVEVLGQLPFLMYLNVSHNSLTKILDFKPPFNLTFVNYSHNSIHQIDDLTNFWSIVHLDLSHNHIRVIEGLQELHYLRHLNLSYNAIECIENLNNMRLLTLLLQHNNIIIFEEGDNVGFKTLIDILRIDLGYNHLKTLKLFNGITGIQSINMVGNIIDDLMELSHLRGLNFLTEIDFRGNPIVNMKSYFEVCVDTVKHIYVLDGEIVDAEKKILVKHSRNPLPFMHAMKKSSKMFFLQQINDPFLGPWIVPIDQPPPPIIILVGPPASNKGKLMQQFCKQHQRFTILGVNHTTRRKNEDEVEGETYYFIDGSTFHTMTLRGEFLTLGQTFGQFYGLAYSEISKTVNESSALFLHMNLSGALTLRARGLRCQLVMAMPSTADVHRQWLFEKYYNWHEPDRFFGVVEVENNPKKAQEFIRDCQNQHKLQIDAMAKGIATEIVDRAIETVDGRAESSLKLNRKRIDDSSQNSLDFVKASASANSSKNSGILKSNTIRNKAADTAHGRSTSVTFQQENDYLSPETSRSQVHLQQSRSVTFGLDIEAFQLSNYYSISGTVVHDHDHGSAINLSAISRSKRDSVESFPITWEVQTEALKAAMEEIVAFRDTYLDVHNSNPGLFTEVIFTDNFPESLEKLKNVLKQSINNQPSAKPTYQYQNDTAYQKMIASRLELLHKDINSELSITQKQFYSMDKPNLLKGKGKKTHKTEKHIPIKPQVGFKNPEDQMESSDVWQF